MPTTAAQDEFNALIHGIGRASPSRPHREDASSSADEKRAASSTSRAALPRSIRQSARADNTSDSDSAAPGGRPARDAQQQPRRRVHIPTHRREANTGPKGVIADAQAFEQARRAARRAAGSTVSLLPPTGGAALPSAAAAMLARRGAGDKEARGSWLANLSESEDEDDEDGAGSDELEYAEGDDAFLASWREARLRELTTGNGRTAGAAGRDRSPLPPGAGPRFGAVLSVDAMGFLDAVESSARETVVVVFIYDDLVRSSLSSMRRGLMRDSPRSAS
jgi:hypothetical protein